MNELILAWVKMMAQKNRAKIRASENDLEELSKLLWREVSDGRKLPAPFPEVIFSKHQSDSWNKKRTELSPEKFKTPEDYYLFYALHFRAAMSEALTRTLYEVQSQAKEKQPEKPTDTLSPENREIARLLAGGRNRQEIARATGRSESEIKRRLYILSKLWGIERTSEIARLAIEARERGYTL